MPIKPVRIKGKRYRSFCAAIRELNPGVSRAVVHKRIKSGWSVEDAILTPVLSREERNARISEVNGTPVSLSDGRWFLSIQKAAAAAGVPISTAYMRHRSGQPIDVARQLGRPRRTDP